MLLNLITVFANTEIFSETTVVDNHEHVNDYSNLGILLTLQILLPSADSKDFVDRPTKAPLKEVVANFEKIKRDLNVIQMITELVNVEKKIRSNNENDDEENERIVKLAHNKIREREKEKIEILNKFIDENYHSVGYDITEHKMEDFHEKLVFLDDLKDEDLKEVGTKLNNTWSELSRKTVNLKNGGVSTLLNLPHPFIIPGGRFREYYYWDTYWILEGLLVSKMFTTASNVVKNFIAIIEEYGYIPNGTRKYYLYRSEPPYFMLMLLKLLDIEDGKYNDLVLNEGLKAGIKEHNWWMKNRTINVEDKNGKTHQLNYYYLTTDYPRPESFKEDFMTFEKQHERSEVTIYTNLKSGAESGWDFSSRWLVDPHKIETIRASEQIPVDLNALLYKNERILHTLLLRKGEESEAAKYLEFSKKRSEAMNSVLWNSKEMCWMDYLYKEKAFVSGKFYFSNIMPLVYEIDVPDKSKSEYDILKKYSKELFGYVGGIPVSSDTGEVSGQQWDYPNVWAPHQHMMVEYLLRIKENEMAFHVAKSFFNSVFSGYKKSKMFFEKYDCNKLGYTGGGGEYLPQAGFGWTNGAILSFMLKFKDKLVADYKFSAAYGQILKLLEEKTRHPQKHSSPEDLAPLQSKMIISVKN